MGLSPVLPIQYRHDGGGRRRFSWLSRKASAAFMHYRGCPLTCLKVIAPFFEFDQQVGIFIRFGRTALGDAAVVIGGTVLTNVLVGGAVDAVIVGGDFREEGEHNTLFVPAEDDDGGFH